MSDLANRLTTPLVNFLGTHPVLFMVIICAVLLAILAVNGLRLAYPDKADRPRWVRFTLGFFDPITGNLWTFLHKLGLGHEATDEISSTSIRAADPGK